MSRRTRTRPPALATSVATALATVALLALAGCSSGGEAMSSQTDAVSAGSASDSGGRSVPRAASVQDASVPDASNRERLFISTGTVALRSRDVADARAAVRRVVDRYRGEVAEQQSESDERGRLEHARLLVRIPSADFAAAVAALEGTAELVSSDTRAEEVTTQVIDTRVALRVQRRSVARVETLLDRASSIRDIIAIEAQLARRQARLGSLEQRAAYLADQTAMSTVSVSIDRSRSRAAAPGDDSGFLAGLRAGWDGLTSVAVVLATTAGALLPFAAVLLLLLVPGWPLVRRLRRRRLPQLPSSPGPSAPA
jgi:hypothetical protein